jgi:DNA-binding SARP family transcriptional activator
MASRPAFALLGPLEVRVDDAVVAVGTPKQRAVLAALVLNRNRPVASDALIDAVWGEDAPTEARASLHAYVSNLRRLLRAAGADGRQLLETAAPGYRLNIAEADVDLGRFIAKRAAGMEAAAAGRFEDASRHLTAGLSEWRGDFLEDLRGFRFTESFAVALTEDRIAAHTVRAQAEIACGRAASVISELEELVAEHPYREPLWGQLMTAYYQAQRQSDALEAYRRLKQVLADDLGIDPASELRDLHELILRQAPLNIARSARATAADTMIATVNRLAFTSLPATARLRPDAGKSHPLDRMVTRIGRQSDNDIVLPDPTVSRHHAVIIRSGPGYAIHDAGSANGITLQNRRIQGSAELTDGDRIVIGDSGFTFELDDSASRVQETSKVI